MLQQIEAESEMLERVFQAVLLVLLRFKFPFCFINISYTRRAVDSHNRRWRRGEYWRWSEVVEQKKLFSLCWAKTLRAEKSETCEWECQEDPPTREPFSWIIYEAVGSALFFPHASEVNNFTHLFHYWITTAQRMKWHGADGQLEMDIEW